MGWCNLSFGDLPTWDAGTVEFIILLIVLFPGRMADVKQQLIMHKNALKAKLNALRKRPSEETSWVRKKICVLGWLTCCVGCGFWSTVSTTLLQIIQWLTTVGSPSASRFRC